MMFRISGILLVLLLAGPSNGQVTATGAMKRTMWEGHRSGLIAMDSLAVKGLYGMGPLEHMRGEITLIDGRCYVARIGDGRILLTVEDSVKAPFFVHGRVSSWEETALPEHVGSDVELEAHLRDITAGRESPFFFRLTGRFSRVDLHVWDLPEGASFSGPQEGARYKVPFSFTQFEGVVIGVFSRDHRTVFTHHDSDIHLHAVGRDEQVMGHVDRLVIDPRSVALWIGRP